MGAPLVYKKSKGKYLRVVVLPEGILEVRVPQRMSLFMAKAFTITQSKMIEALYAKQERKLLELKSRYDTRLLESHSGPKLTEYKKEALLFVSEHLQTLKEKKEFSYKKVQIKNTSSRWGSCSSRGTLCFHYKILFLPKELQMYLLIHELCHLKHMNHGKSFWAAVKEIYPEYEAAKRGLKSIPIFS